MNNPPRNRRKTFLIAVGLVCVLLSICIIYLCNTSGDDSPPKFLSTSNSKPEATDNLIDAAEPSASFKVLQRTSVTVPETPNPQKNAGDIPPVNFTTSPILSSRPTPLYRSGSLAIAVVDVERLLSELLPNAASPDMRAQTIRDIQRTISSRAAAHNLDLVFDMSGKSLNDVPFVSRAARVFDLTEEIRHELTKQNDPSSLEEFQSAGNAN